MGIQTKYLQELWLNLPWHAHRGRLQLLPRRSWSSRGLQPSNPSGEKTQEFSFAATRDSDVNRLNIYLRGRQNQLGEHLYLRHVAAGFHAQEHEHDVMQAEHGHQEERGLDQLPDKKKTV